MAEPDRSMWDLRKIILSVLFGRTGIAFPAGRHAWTLPCNNFLTRVLLELLWTLRSKGGRWVMLLSMRPNSSGFGIRTDTTKWSSRGWAPCHSQFVRIASRGGRYIIAPEYYKAILSSPGFLKRVADEEILFYGQISQNPIPHQNSWKSVENHILNLIVRTTPRL